MPDKKTVKNNFKKIIKNYTKIKKVSDPRSLLTCHISTSFLNSSTDHPTLGGISHFDPQLLDELLMFQAAAIFVFDSPHLRWVSLPL